MQHTGKVKHKNGDIQYSYLLVNLGKINSNIFLWCYIINTLNHFMNKNTLMNLFLKKYTSLKAVPFHGG